MIQDPRLYKLYGVLDEYYNYFTRTDKRSIPGGGYNKLDVFVAQITRISTELQVVFWSQIFGAN